MKFYKCQATGNDFVFLFGEFRPAQKKNLVLKLCQEHYGIGADGVVFLHQSKGEWHWDFYNRDASPAAFCGNAALCAAKLLSVKYPRRKSFTLVTEIGKLELKAAKRYSEVLLSRTFVYPKPLPPELSDELLLFNERGLSEMALVEAGVPHLVLCNHEVWNPQDRVANNMTLCRHASLAPQGANITWYSHKSGEAVTFERGVYKETLGCGSGALALHHTLGAKGMQTFKFPGGELSVGANKSSIILRGNPQLLFSGQLHELKA
jgi:diaminopimelate epimerase